MTRPWQPLLTALFALLLLAGCGTTQDHRVRVYTRDFNALDVERQEMIREGRIDTGFNSRMVYMALGEPRDSRREPAIRGERVIWTYAGLIDDSPDARAPFRTTNDLIWGSPFRRNAYDRLYVAFLNDSVVAIETVRRRE